MTFEEYANTITWATVAERAKARAVWEAAWGEAYMKGFKDGQTVVKQQPNYRKVNVGW